MGDGVGAIGATGELGVLTSTPKWGDNKEVGGVGEVSVFDPGAAVDGDVAVDVGTISDAGVTADCGITADACGFVDGGGFVNSGVSTDQCGPCDGGVIVGLGVVNNPAVKGKPVGESTQPPMSPARTPWAGMS